ncbi:MAG: ice-binding family protein [Dehalococcoidia bacterium]|jgi:hypothetical protein
MKEIFRSILRGALALVMVLSVGLGALLSVTSPAQAATAPSLGTAGNYSVLAGTTVTNTGNTVIIGGDVGVAPGSAITGFPPGTVLAPNIIHVGNDAATILAQTDLTTAYNAAAGQPYTQDYSGTDLGSLPALVPGVYKFTSAAQLTGTLTLNGGPTDVWIFQIGSTLTTAANSRVVFQTGSGGKSCNVFWQVGSSATLGTGSAIVGNVLALTTITMNTGATIAGRVLARNGAVNLDTAAITVCSLCTTITLAPTTLPNGQLSVPYSRAITATGGTGTYTYTVIAGAQPTGLTLASGGLLSGTPTATGTFTFTVQATDTGVTPNCFGSWIYTIVINPAGCPTITLAPTPPLPAGTIGIVYATQTITASNGTGPYIFTYTGSLPAGLTLSSAGVLSGTPTTAGSFTFTVTATDTKGSPANCSGAQIYNIVVNGGVCPPIAVAPMNLPAVVEGEDYIMTFMPSGGQAPYMFFVTYGSVPLGLKLSSDGKLSGTPKRPGTYTFTITAIDANGCLGSRVYPLHITLAPAENPRGSGGVPATSNQGASPSQVPPVGLSNYVISTVCASTEGTSDKVTLCLKNTGTTPQTVVATLRGNNADIGQKTFNLGANAVVCDFWLVSGAQKAATYRVNVGGAYEQDVPLCIPGSASGQASSDLWIYLLIALAVIVIIVILYFVMRKR